MFSSVLELVSLAMAETSSVDVLPQPLPQDLFLDFDAELEQQALENGGAGVGAEELFGGGGGEREGAASPQFSTTSTVSGDLNNTNPFPGSTDSLDQNRDSGKPDELMGGVQEDKEAVVATTTATWERFEPVTTKSSWETFDRNGQGEGGAGHMTGANGTTEGTGISSEGATAMSPASKLAAQSEDETGAVCAADALVSTGWMALGEDIGPRAGEEEDEPNLPFRQTRSMRATTNRKVQIVDALKQQRRLSNTSLERDPSRGGGPFANEDELSRRYNVDREWQVFVKMSKRVPGTR